MVNKRETMNWALFFFFSSLKTKRKSAGLLQWNDFYQNCYAGKFQCCDIQLKSRQCQFWDNTKVLWAQNTLKELDTVFPSLKLNTNCTKSISFLSFSTWISNLILLSLIPHEFWLLFAWLMEWYDNIQLKTQHTHIHNCIVVLCVCMVQLCEMMMMPCRWRCWILHVFTYLHTQWWRWE